MDGAFFISDQYLVDLASRSLIPFMNLLIKGGYGFCGLVFIMLGLKNFNKLSVGSRSIGPDQRSKYIWGGIIGLVVGGFLVAGTQTINLTARTVVVSNYQALSYSGEKYTGLADKTSFGFVYGLLYLIGAWLIFVSFTSAYKSTQSSNVSISRVVTLFIVGGALVQSKEVITRLQNTVSTNTSISQTNQ